MTDVQKEEKINQLIENGLFLQAMKEAKSKEDLQEIFKKFGLAMSRDDIDEFVLLAEKSLDEFCEEDLETVAGGSGVGAVTVFYWAWKATKAIAKKCWNAGKRFANWEANL